MTSYCEVIRIWNRWSFVWLLALRDENKHSEGQAAPAAQCPSDHRPSTHLQHWIKELRRAFFLSLFRTFQKSPSKSIHHEGKLQTALPSLFPLLASFSGWIIFKLPEQWHRAGEPLKKVIQAKQNVLAILWAAGMKFGTELVSMLCPSPAKSLMEE